MHRRVEARREALCVRVLWGEQRLATHVVRDAPLELGDGARPVRFDADGGFGVTFREGVAGEVLRNGETPLSLGDAVHRGLATETAGGWRLAVGRSDLVRLRRGPLVLEALRVAAPARVPVALGERVDYRFLNVTVVCFALAFGFLAQAHFEEVASDDDTPTTAELATLRRVLVKPAPPPPKRQASAEPAQVEKPTRAARTAPPPEGRPRSTRTPPRDGGGARLPELTKGLFAGAGVQGVLGAGGLGAELGNALGHVVAATGDGMGGWSLRGSGTGGPGGESIGIGRIATSGVAGRTGIGDLCGGPGPCKKGADISISVSEPIGCGSADVRACMDKELIRKVIASHRDQLRYCYELSLQGNPSLAGKVTVGFSVSPEGSVPSATVQASTLQSPVMESCLLSRVRTWRFPVPPRSPGYRVSYPFLFRPPGA